jgi:hypothetical protein
MLEAGLKIVSVRDTHVTHHPEMSRRLRANWLATAPRFGEGGAYIMHRWEHVAVALSALRALALRIKLYLRRLPQGTPSLDERGMHRLGNELVRIAMLERFIIERRKPRKYGLRGLRKMA